MNNKIQIVSDFNTRFKEAFGNRSVTEFAMSIGVSKQTISAYLQGKRKPKRPTTEVIAEKLGVSPCWLCGYDVPMLVDKKHNSNDEKKLVVHLNDEKELKLVKLMQTLSDEEKDLLIAQIEVFLSKQ